MIKRIMLILCMLVATVGTGTLVAGCNPNDPAASLVITENTNLKQNTPALVSPIPINQLGGTIGTTVKQQFANRNSTPVLTVNSNLAGNAGAVVIPLDPAAAKDAFSSSPDLITFLENLVDGVTPFLPFAPWVKLALGALYLIHPNSRTGVGNAISRLVPGMTDPNGNSGMPVLSDVKGSVMDVARAAILALPVASHNV